MLILKCLRKKFGPIFNELLKFLPKKFSVCYALKYMALDPGSGIGFFRSKGHRIPDPDPQHCSVVKRQDVMWRRLARKFRRVEIKVPADIRGRILWRNPDKSLESFPPSCSKWRLQLCLEISISSNSRNLLQCLQCVSVHCKGESRKTW